MNSPPTLPPPRITPSSFSNSPGLFQGKEKVVYATVPIKSKRKNESALKLGEIPEEPPVIPPESTITRTYRKKKEKEFEEIQSLIDKYNIFSNIESDIDNLEELKESIQNKIDNIDKILPMDKKKIVDLIITQNIPISNRLGSLILQLRNQRKEIERVLNQYY